MTKKIFHRTDVFGRAYSAADSVELLILRLAIV
jgi:hypothetical protein